MASSTHDAGHRWTVADLDKTHLYAEAGVASYWRVELLPVPRLVVQELHDGAYVEVAVGATVGVQAPFPVVVSLY